MFTSSFIKDDYIKVGLVLCILIKDQMLRRSQRIIAFILLYDLYQNKSLYKNSNINNDNIFLYFLFDSIEQCCDSHEKVFLIQLLTSSIEVTTFIHFIIILIIILSDMAWNNCISNID